MANDAAWQQGWATGERLEERNKEHKRSRQEQLDDAHRNDKILMYANTPGITTAQLAHSIEDVYHDAEPEKKMNILRRLVQRKKAHQQHQEFVQGRRASAADQAGILSSPNVQPGAPEAAKAKGELSATQDVAKVVQEIMANPNLSDDAKRTLASLYGAKTFNPTAASQSPFKEYVSPDGKQRQWFRVDDQPEGWQAETGGPSSKPPTPSATYANLLSKKILADKKQGPPLTNEENAQLAGAKGALTVAGVERANAFAKAAAENNLVVTTNDEGQDVLTQRAQAVEASKSGKPMTAGVVGAPTATDKQTQMFAQSSLDRLKEMRSIVKAHPEIFGPVGGRTMKASVWFGSQSPEAQKFKQDAQFLAEHSTAVFGGRAASTVEALQKVQSDPTANPEALLAGFDSDEATLNDFVTAQGRLPAPRVQGGASSPKKNTAPAGRPKEGDTKKIVVTPEDMK
jgi:hypothetical protein